jgi:hypothetical protein
MSWRDTKKDIKGENVDSECHKHTQSVYIQMRLGLCCSSVSTCASAREKSLCSLPAQALPFILISPKIVPSFYLNLAMSVSSHQGLQRGHDTEGDSRDNALELTHLAEEAEEAKGPQDPQLLDPAIRPATKVFVLEQKDYSQINGKIRRRPDNVCSRNGLV